MIINGRKLLISCVLAFSLISLSGCATRSPHASVSKSKQEKPSPVLNTLGYILGFALGYGLVGGI